MELDTNTFNKEDNTGIVFDRRLRLDATPPIWGYWCQVQLDKFSYYPHITTPLSVCSKFRTGKNSPFHFNQNPTNSELVTHALENMCGFEGTQTKPHYQQTCCHCQAAQLGSRCARVLATSQKENVRIPTESSSAVACTTLYLVENAAPTLPDPHTILYSAFPMPRWNRHISNSYLTLHSSLCGGIELTTSSSKHWY